MNTTIKNILILVLVVALILMVSLYYNMKKEDCYNLPKSPDPTVFGPKYWAAFHDMTHKIPCGACRGFAEKFMVFFHDVINIKISKPVYDQENYNEMLAYINTQKA